ncbi:hypothetical protein BH10ACT1_BH10ACT1_39660 [soil metagenome]
MSDPHEPEPTPIAPQVELTVDLGAFLPETSAIGPVDEPVAEPVAPAREPVDVAVLAGIEADLTAVDEALAAIDAGEPGRSPLLTELLADPPPT